VDSINTPKLAQSGSKGPVHHLRTATTALTLAASVLTVAAQVLEHYRKPKAGPNQRTKAGDALLGLAVLRTMPALIKSARSLAADLKKVK
jgi:negative regulator of sigma E activity